MERARLQGVLAGKVSRRRFAIGAGALAGLALAGSRPGGALARPRFAADPFSLGVASGDPTPDSVILWTRLALDPLGGGGMPPRPVAVDWEVATDEGLRDVVRRGTALATPELAHAVHIDVRGLAPDRWYWYRFAAGDALSPVGRTRTTPAAGAAVERLRFAFVSCQDWQNGYFTAYEGLAREDLDLVVHLGDYIYEYGPRPGGPRRHTDGPEVGSLASYRNRHALYKTDPALQAAHAAFPFVVTWDDHEVENNYAGAIDEEPDTDPAAFLARRAAAYQAYYEHLPLRLSAPPQGPEVGIYWRLPYGDLAEFSLLDTRQYRTDQPCGDGIQARCAAALSEAQTMAGPAQERWLLDGLDRSAARWNVIAQQTILAQYDFRAGPERAFNMDQWDGYVAARNRLLGFLLARRPANPVVITGDIHSSWVHDLKADFDTPASATVGTEFVGTSISSDFPQQAIAPVTAALADNPHTKFFDGANRGYVRCDLSRRRWLTDFRAVPTVGGQVLVADGPVTTLASFVVEDGVPGAQRA
jgi:alkaline phosphatase D